VSEKKREPVRTVRDMVAETLEPELREAISNLREEFGPIRPQIRELARRTLNQRLNIVRGQVFREGAMPSPPEEMTEEEKKTREALLSKIVGSLEPEISAVAVDIIKNGVQDALQSLDTGTLKSLSETPDIRLRRRMGRGRGDPLVIEVGDGIKQPVREVPIFV